MRNGYDGGHLGQWLEEYVDGALPADDSRRAARHLLVCETCRADVDAERAILTRLRSVQVDPERHACLVEGLLALSSACSPQATSNDERPTSEPSTREHSTSETARSTLRRPPRTGASPRTGMSHGSVALVSLAAPPQYRGERRRPVILGAAALAVCGVALVTVHATPQRAAPGAPQMARSGQMPEDELAAPSVHVVGVRAQAGDLTAQTGVMRLKSTASGRIGP